MPTIVFSSPKGGSSKTTSALILATELAGQGATVTVIDADPNRPIARWSKRTTKPPKGIRVVEGVTENTIIDVIERLVRRRGRLARRVRLPIVYPARCAGLQ